MLRSSSTLLLIIVVILGAEHGITSDGFFDLETLPKQGLSTFACSLFCFHLGIQ